MTISDAQTEKLRRLEALLAYVAACDLCDLCAERGTVVFGEGDPEASIMFVGEAPGKKEDELGRPFVGAAGRFLDTLLAEVELSRERVYIANILKCRPPANRDPRREEIDSCTPHLRKQIEIIRPRILAPLGNFATRFILGIDEGISKIHGRTFEAAQWGHDLLVVPLYHPAAALYNPLLRKVLLQDVKILKTL